MNLQLQAGYFSIKNPLDIFDRWLNPFHHYKQVDIRGKNLNIMTSRRAERLLAQRDQPLIAELQLYFTCVVQKRVLFHDAFNNNENIDILSANNKLHIAYHTVQSNACNPVEFAATHPVKKELKSNAAKSMRPSLFQLDFKNGQWVGEFSI
ncbi:MAG: hypothetical protein QM484_12085 [Woeseiaceae bacterium]